MQYFKNLKFLTVLFAFMFVNISLIAQQPNDKTVATHKANSDSITKLKYRVALGTATLELGASQIQYNGYSCDFYSGGIISDVKGGVVSAEIIYDIKYNPISLVGDISSGMINFNVSQYDTNHNNIGNSRIQKMNFTTLGLGILIDGKRVFAGAKYKIGYMGGGIIADPLPYKPEIIRNNQMNFISNLYQGIEISLGIEVKQFFVTFKQTWSLKNTISVGNGWKTDVLLANLSVGYTFKGKTLR